MPGNLVFVDVETTGLDPTKHEIVEIAAVVVDADDLEVLWIEHHRIPITDLKAADPRALEINHYSHEQWLIDGVTWPEAWRRVAPLLEGNIAVGHNVRFDLGFIDAMNERYELAAATVDGFIDTLEIAKPLGITGVVPSLRLDDLCELLDIRPEGAVAHTAMGDVLRTIKLFKVLS